jgi:Uma2 family endonuclease
MTTTLLTPAVKPKTASSAAAGDARIVWPGVGWEGYLALLKVQGEKARPQLVYLDGNVWIMSPSPMHERFNVRLALFVLCVTEELDIPCEPTGETSFKSHVEDEAGVQPDASFYLANHPVMAAKDGKQDIDLRVDPPPDLVIEVVHSHPADHAVEVCRRFRVPEVWVCDENGLTFLILGRDGQYVSAERSLSFPFLTAAEVFDWVSRPGMSSGTQWIKALRAWVREVLLPRYQAQRGSA